MRGPAPRAPMRADATGRCAQVGTLDPMSLTIGTAPFGPNAAGEWNLDYDGPAHALYLLSLIHI